MLKELKNWTGVIMFRIYFFLVIMVVCWFLQIDFSNNTIGIFIILSMLYIRNNEGKRKKNP